MTMIAPNIQVVAIDDIQPHPANPRKGNLAAIRESIREHGFVGVIAVQISTSRIVIGRHRWEAAKAEGFTQVPVLWLELTDEQALRLLLADNRASDLAGYDDDALLRSLRDIGNLQGTLFDQDALETLIAKVGETPTIAPEFKGDYADAGAEMEERAKSADRIGQEMRDVVVVMKPAEYAVFIAEVKDLQKRLGIAGVSATIIAAVHMLVSEQPLPDAGKIDRMRSWRKELEWAVPYTERARFLEDFA
jgi:hypothetical protein